MIIWESLNEKIARVKQDGTIQAIAEGTTKINAKCGNITKQITVNVVKKLPFTDVKASSWYYPAVKYVYENNIITGTNSYTFSPTTKLTRGMLVTILYRMEGAPTVTGAPKFSDVKDSSKYYYKAVKWASDKKIVSGYQDGRFGPGDNVTREQLAVILNSYAKYKGKNVSATNNLSVFEDKDKIASWALPQVKWACRRWNNFRKHIQ